MSRRYVAEKARDSLHCLLCAPGGIRARLVWAWRALTPAEPHLHHLPIELQDDYRSLLAGVSLAEPEAGEGTVVAALRSMGTERVVDMAHRLWDFCEDVARVAGPPWSVGVLTREQTPEFLVRFCEGESLAEAAGAMGLPFVPFEWIVDPLPFGLRLEEPPFTEDNLREVFREMDEGQ
jgi:hypothetical protein